VRSKIRCKDHVVDLRSFGGFVLSEAYCLESHWESSRWRGLLRWRTPSTRHGSVSESLMQCGSIQRPHPPTRLSKKSLGVEPRLLPDQFPGRGSQLCDTAPGRWRANWSALISMRQSCQDFARLGQRSLPWRSPRYWNVRLVNAAQLKIPCRVMQLTCFGHGPGRGSIGSRLMSH
jgi:hypothetical protein